jgi:hypothetical protein
MAPKLLSKSEMVAAANLWKIKISCGPNLKS